MRRYRRVPTCTPCARVCTAQDVAHVPAPDRSGVYALSTRVYAPGRGYTHLYSPVQAYRLCARVCTPFGRGFTCL